MKQLFAPIAILVLAGSAHAAPTAAGVLADVQKFYASTPQLQAKFTEHVVTAAFGTAADSRGNVYVAKPASFRFDYNDKQAKLTKTFVFDGKTFAFVDHLNMQITKRAVSGALPAAVGFLTGASSLTTDFTATLDTSGTYGGTGATVIALTPKQPSAQYAELYFVVDPTDGHVRESIVVDANHNSTDLKFFNQNVKTPIPAKTFAIPKTPVAAKTLVP